MIRWQRMLVHAAVGLTALAGAVGAKAAGTTRPATPPVRAGEFVMVSESQAQSTAFGMVMICPSHAHGTPDEAERKLRLLLQNESGQPSTIWVCRSGQIDTLRRFAPLVQRVVVNPFGHFSAKRPEASEAYWPGVELPVLDGLAEIRAVAGDRQLLACLDLNGEPSLFGQRPPSYEEIEWQAYAAIGSGFQGLVWRNPPEDPERARRLKGLESRLREIAPELGAVRPVRWASAVGGQPVTALLSNGVLFVVLLNPEYLAAQSPMGPSAGVRLPLGDREQSGQVQLSLPNGQMVVSARTLSGRMLPTQASGDRVTIPYRFRGGGQILICRLSDNGQTAADAD